MDPLNLFNIESIEFISKGSLITLNFTATSFVIGFLVGVLLALMKISESIILRIIATFYVSVFRGTPTLVQLSIFYFSFPVLFNLDITAYQAGILTFSLNSAAYIAEILRGGINSVNKGQFEASKALNIPYWLMMKNIIIPQASKMSLPALVNEFVNLLKETAIVSFIGVYDLMKRAQVVSAEKYIYFEPLITAAICYYVMVLIFSSLAKFIEGRVR